MKFAMAYDIKETLEGGGRIFLDGCGSTDGSLWF
jgi:hypothetical protein